jgi:hypothetical protein
VALVLRFRSEKLKKSGSLLYKELPFSLMQKYENRFNETDVGFLF